MKKVLINSEILNVDSPLFSGVISNLLKLNEKGYSLALSNNEVFENKTLNNIFKSEGLKFLDNKNCDFKLDVIKDGKNQLCRVNGKNFETFKDAIDQIIFSSRKAKINRKTKETEIKININLDGNGISKISTGIGFFDHMLEQISKHANFDLEIKVKGDLNVDEHHTVEDVGISLGESISKALGKKLGIQRYGFVAPMDESVSVCAIDLGGRSNLKFKCKFKREFVGEFPTELTEEFFRGLSSGIKANIYIKTKGKNDHHKIESIFKAFAKALNEACRIDERNNGFIPSTKGLI